MTLKLISLNIEKDRHLEAVLPFLKEKRGDGFEVFCLQEVFRDDIPKLQEVIGGYVQYSPMVRYMGNQERKEDDEQGVAIFTVNAPVRAEHFTYYKDGNNLPEATDSNTLVHASAIFCEIVCDSEVYHVATTHFPVSALGEIDERQDAAFVALSDRLKEFPELIFCGDFNAPRGREIHNRFLAFYKDNIPAEVTSTLDPVLHRVGHLPYVVDGLFTTPHYSATNVEIVNGLSDHKAIVARIKKR